MKKKVQIGILMVFLLTGCQIFQSHAGKMRVIGEKVEEQGWEVEADIEDNRIYVTYIVNKEGNTTLDFSIRKEVLNAKKGYNKDYIAFSKEDGNLQYGILYNYKENEQSKYAMSKNIVGSIYEISPYDFVCRTFVGDNSNDNCNKVQKEELIDLDKELTTILEEAGIDKEEFMDYVYWKYVPEDQKNKEQNEN